MKNKNMRFLTLFGMTNWFVGYQSVLGLMSPNAFSPLNTSHVIPNGANLPAGRQGEMRNLSKDVHC